jgi:hypothetical protein
MLNSNTGTFLVPRGHNFSMAEVEKLNQGYKTYLSDDENKHRNTMLDLFKFIEDKNQYKGIKSTLHIHDVTLTVKVDNETFKMKCKTNEGRENETKVEFILENRAKYRKVFGKLLEKDKVSEYFKTSILKPALANDLQRDKSNSNNSNINLEDLNLEVHYSKVYARNEERKNRIANQQTPSASIQNSEMKI